MLRNGTTCFVDANILVSLGHVDAVAQAVTESGMRAVLGRGVFDLMPQAMADAMPPELRSRVLFPSADAALREVDALLGRWTRSADGRIRSWATVYGLFPYCSDELFAGLRAIAHRHRTGMAFHISSSIEEARGVEARVGTWPITHLDHLGVLGPDLLLTHCADRPRGSDPGRARHQGRLLPGSRPSPGQGHHENRQDPRDARRWSYRFARSGWRVLERLVRPRPTDEPRRRSLQGCAHGPEPDPGRDGPRDGHPARRPRRTLGRHDRVGRDR